MRSIGMTGRVICLIGALSGAAYCQGNNGCSNASLAGTWIFSITGQILAPAAAAGPVSGVALTTFDGFGNLTQVDHVVHNGATPVEDWRPATGSYTVNADCTGTYTFTPQPTVAADAGPALKCYFVLGNGGTEIMAVVSGSPTSPPFTSSIVASAKRLFGH